MACQYSKYFRSCMGQHKKYFSSFVIFEILNVVVICFNMYINNIFLNEKFITYGFDVIKYYSMPRAQRKNEIDPTCNVFPTTVSYTGTVYEMKSWNMGLFYIPISCNELILEIIIFNIILDVFISHHKINSIHFSQTFR